MSRALTLIGIGRRLVMAGLLAGFGLAAGLVGSAAAQSARPASPETARAMKLIGPLIAPSPRAKRSETRCCGTSRQRWQSNTIRHLPAGAQPRHWEPR